MGSFCDVLPKGFHICCEVPPPPSKLPTPTFIQIFWKLLSTCSLKCIESPLVCQEASRDIFNIILSMTIDLHCICLKSCVALDSRAWLFTRPLIPSFHMLSHIFSTTLCTKLGFPYLVVLGLAHHIYG